MKISKQEILSSIRPKQDEFGHYKASFTFPDDFSLTVIWTTGRASAKNQVKEQLFESILKQWAKHSGGVELID